MSGTIALDLASKTGWAHSSGDSGVQVFSGNPGQRWVQFASWMRDMACLYSFDRVVYEKCHHRGYHATHQGHVMIGLLEWACHELGIAEPVGIHSATIKKHATGKGNAKKEDMALAAANRNPGRKFIDDNEIDALFLLDLALGL